MRNKAIAVLISIVLLGGCADNTPYVNSFDRYYANLAPEPVNTAPIAEETQQDGYRCAYGDSACERALLRREVEASVPSRKDS
jgi:hypothetical protein